MMVKYKRRLIIFLTKYLFWFFIELMEELETTKLVSFDDFFDNKDRIIKIF